MQVLVHSQQTKRVPGTGLAIQVTDTNLEGIGSYRYGSRGQNLGTNSYLYIPRSVYEPGAERVVRQRRHNFKAGVPPEGFRHRRCRPEPGPEPDQPGAGPTRSATGVPTNVTIWAVPYGWEEWGTDISVFAQDQWTLGRATLNLGLRYNDVKSSTGGYTLPAGPFVPERRSRCIENVPHWRNLNPRVGLAYDLFGTGRTAFKVSLGRYTPQVRSTNAAAPAVSVSPSTTRTWNDANGNYVPDCVLLNPQPTASAASGTTSRSARTWCRTRNAPDAIEGFNLPGRTTGRVRRPSSTSCDREWR